MSLFNENYLDAPFEVKQGYLQNAAYQPPTDRSRLQQLKAALESKLENVNKALAALDAHPELEEFVETIKAGLNL